MLAAGLGFGLSDLAAEQSDPSRLHVLLLEAVDAERRIVDPEVEIQVGSMLPPC